VTDGEFVTQLSTNARISVWRIVWVMTNCRSMSDMSIFKLNIYVCRIRKLLSASLLFVTCWRMELSNGTCRVTIYSENKGYH